MATAHWLLSLLVGGSTLLAVQNLEARPVRPHMGLQAGHAVGGHQERELGWGGAVHGGFDYRLIPVLGVGLEVGGLWLAQGRPPRDPGLARLGSASAFWGAIDLVVCPLARSNRPPIGVSGLWLSAAAGVTQTGGLVRPLFAGRLGWDFPVARWLAAGPEAAYLHVYQPDDELRPSDAHLILAGLHLVFDQARPESSEDRDRDADGIRDSVDRCPDTPEDRDRFQDEDGCPDLDNDQDGILDSADRCPNQPEDRDGFQDDDGCPDPDNDQDGIPDAQDLCPSEPETRNGYADQDGCPDEEQVRVLGDKIVLDDRVHFATNSPRIRVVSFPLLRRLAKLIREHPEYVHIHIQGHADERGPEKFNQWLSEERAKSVLRFLVEQGIEESRLSSEGLGSTRPLVEGSSEGAWFLNRRVEFTVTRQRPASEVQDEGPRPSPVPSDTEAGTSPAPSVEAPSPPAPGAGEAEETNDKEPDQP